MARLALCSEQLVEGVWGPCAVASRGRVSESSSNQSWWFLSLMADGITPQKTEVLIGSKVPWCCVTQVPAPSVYQPRSVEHTSPFCVFRRLQRSGFLWVLLAQSYKGKRSSSTASPCMIELGHTHTMAPALFPSQGSVMRTSLMFFRHQGGSQLYANVIVVGVGRCYLLPACKADHYSKSFIPSAIRPLHALLFVIFILLFLI